jgi:hypothetical protein
VSRDEKERLRDIKDAVLAIRQHLARAGEVPSDDDAALLHDALLFQFVVIGRGSEAVYARNSRGSARDPVGGYRRAP